MNYFEELNKFWRTGITNHLTPNASLLYLCLLDIANSRHWPNQFAVKSFVLKESTGIEKKDTVYDTRNRLKQIGLIDFMSNRGSKIVNYKILGVDNALKVLDSEGKSSDEVPEKKPKKKVSSKDKSSGEEAQKKGNLSDSSPELDPNLPGSSSDLDPCTPEDTSDSGIVKRNVNKTKRNNNKNTQESDKNPSVKILIDYYHDGFVKKFGEKPVINGGKDGDLLKKLLTAGHAEEKIKSWFNEFFVSQDPFIINSGYTVGVFYSQINKFLTTKKSAGGSKYAGIVHKNGQNL